MSHFFFDFVDFVLDDGLDGLPEEFLSLFDGDGFDVIDDLSVGCVFGIGFHVIIVGGALFEPV